MESNRREFMAIGGAAVAAGALSTHASAEDAPLNAMLPTPKQMQEFLELPDDGPIVMLNLLKFKAEGGREEYLKYGVGVQAVLKSIGAEMIFSASAEFCLIGNGQWDAVAMVRYPNKKAIAKMSTMPEYQAIHPHREAGLEGQILYALRENAAV